MGKEERKEEKKIGKEKQKIERKDIGYTVKSSLQFSVLFTDDFITDLKSLLCNSLALCSELVFSETMNATGPTRESQGELVNKESLLLNI